jgi:hypothetical protein
MIPQEKINQEYAKTVCTTSLETFTAGVRFAEAELKPNPTTSALDYLKQIGRREIESMHGMTGEYIITPDQMDEYAQQTAMELAELIYTWECKLELLNVSIFNLSEAADPNTMTTFTVLQYQQMQLTQCINDLKQLFAKFEAERIKNE